METGKYQNPYSYAVEKLTNALECLATHPGDVRKRLESAYHSFYVLSADNFPPDCREEWSAIINELTKYGPTYKPNGELWFGSIHNTMLQIHNSTASKIAKRIYDIYWRVSKNQQYS